MLKIIVIGATSGIAQAVAKCYADQGARLYLVARNAEKLATVAADLKARGASEVKSFAMDAHNTAVLPGILDEAWQESGEIDIAIVAHGSLSDQHRADKNMSYLSNEFRTNAESVIVCLAELAQRFEQQNKGVIAVIGSVAGDRGSARNYLYAAAKAAIATYASGLRSRLFKKGIHVLTIKPGPVTTPMTANINVPRKLLASPEKVAKEICQAIAKRRDVLYTPKYWRIIMTIVRMLPGPIYKRIKL